MHGFPHYKQTDAMTCGPACLQIISAYYEKKINMAVLAKMSKTTREGSTLLGLSEAAEKIGFRTLGTKIALQKLTSDLILPCIAHWNQEHFVVVYKITRNRVYVSDPAHGLLKYTKKDFCKHWIGNENSEGVLLLLEPGPEFFDEEHRIEDLKRESSFGFIFSYLTSYRKPILQLMIGLIGGSLLQLIFPFLTQSIIDIGIQNRDINFIYIILLAQLMVFFGRITIEIIRNYILIHISTRINISLISDFFIKLMKLPISYFDTKMTGDIMQRISDNNRIESFLTGSSLNTLFSFFNFIIFSVVLVYYSSRIFFVFLAGSILYFIWILFFLKQRADVDYKRFSQSSQNQSKVIEIINGMQEIKLYNAERQKRWQWEALQIKLFKINLKSLSLTTIQNSGSALINELKNIIITFLAAKLVLDGQMTLGMMLSISYIIGQLNTPVLEMVGFIQHWQDAKLSLIRLNEIHHRNDEEQEGEHMLRFIEPQSPFIISNLSFKYEGSTDKLVLKNLSATILSKKVTAIVGASGSGKTTLLKLLLKYYEPESGTIHIGSLDLQSISSSYWRSKCGVVMQEGYIFNDTIANNIAVGVDEIDIELLKFASEIANIKEYIEELPMGYNTRIGMEGNGLSTGQKQRILIARAVYKKPDYLFFDEATSALDANNEKIIMNNLNGFFNNRTVVVIAHRLSTVKHADQIIVLDKGQIIERGTHNELTELKGAYYELVKNQLELGN